MDTRIQYNFLKDKNKHIKRTLQHSIYRDFPKNFAQGIYI